MYLFNNLKIPLLFETNARILTFCVHKNVIKIPDLYFYLYIRCGRAGTVERGQKGGMFFRKLFLPPFLPLERYFLQRKITHEFPAFSLLVKHSVFFSSSFVCEDIGKFLKAITRKNLCFPSFLFFFSTLRKKTQTFKF